MAEKISLRALIFILVCGCQTALFAQDVDVKLQEVLRDPAVNIVLESNPQTPEQLVRATRSLIDLRRPDLAKPYVKRLVDANLDEAKLVELVETFGVPTFLQFVVTKEIRPEGRAFGEKALAAAKKHATDPNRIGPLVEELKSESLFARQRAMQKLKSAGSQAIPPMLAILADPAQAEHHSHVRRAIVWQEDAAFFPLLAVLQSDNAGLKAQAITMLGAGRYLEAVPFLLYYTVADGVPENVRQEAEKSVRRLFGRVPDRAEVLGTIRGAARSYYEQLERLPVDAAGNVEIWLWDAGQKQPVAQEMLKHDASVELASRLAEDAYRLTEQQAAVRRLYLGSILEAAAYRAGLDNPIPSGMGTAYDKAKALGVGPLEQLVEQSFHTSHTPAAKAAVQVLADIGDQGLLYGSADPTVLVEAAVQPDRRLRLAAAQAMWKLKPQRPFVGGSDVLRSIAHLATHSGRPRAIVAESNGLIGRQIAGLLSEVGYEVELVTDGRELIQEAARGDVELVLIGMGLQRPRPHLALGLLRKDFRTAALPVGLIGGTYDEERATEIARRDDLAIAMVRPQDADGMEHWVAELLARYPRRYQMTTAARIAQADAALDLLLQLSEKRSATFDVKSLTEELFVPLQSPQLAVKAAQVLANLGTPASQTALVDVASATPRKDEVREAAAQGFAASVDRYGTLLTTDQILAQYDRYNAAATADAKTQSILGSILDAIEAKAKSDEEAQAAKSEKTD